MRKRKTAICRRTELLPESIKYSKLPEGSEGESKCYAQHSSHHFLVVKQHKKVFKSVLRMREASFSRLVKAIFVVVFAYAVAIFILVEIHIPSTCKLSYSPSCLLHTNVTTCLVNCDRN